MRGIAVHMLSHAFAGARLYVDAVGDGYMAHTRR
jgi:hypothetical protein